MGNNCHAQVVSLLTPPEGWGDLTREEIAFGVAAVNFFPTVNTWGKEYYREVDASLRDAIQRVVESMTTIDLTRIRMSQTKLAGFVEFCYINPFKVIQRGDYRYSSKGLLRIIEAGYDLVPIVSGKDCATCQIHVLDGHHRLRAYIAAKKRVPAWVCWVGPGIPATITFSCNLTRNKLDK